MKFMKMGEDQIPLCFIEIKVPISLPFARLAFLTACTVLFPGFRAVSAVLLLIDAEPFPPQGTVVGFNECIKN
jgi:hypothetical protein